jgi:hypothetical protein
VPTNQEWHRDLLRQMNNEIPGIRPTVVSEELVNAWDEYLRFRHVVRNVYTFSFRPDQIERLVIQIRPIFNQTQHELASFADFLKKVGQD